MKLHSIIQFQPNQRLNTNAKIKDFDAICLEPLEWYCQTIDVQITDTDIVEVVDCNNNVLEDVLFFTSGLFFEFTLLNEYYQQIRLKATTSNGVYYSNPFVCYDNDLTLRFDYKLNDFYQSIRVQGIATSIENESQVDTYVESRGIKLSGYSTLTTKQNYIFDYLDNFTVLAINEALAYPIVYVNCVRVTDKPLLKGSPIEGESNQLATESQGAVDLFDEYEPTLQIAPPLQLINATPQGIYTSASFENLFQAVFNHVVEINNNLPIKLFRNGLEIKELEIDLINNQQVNFRSFTYNFQNDIYQWIIPAGKFNSIFGSHLELIINFEIRNADYEDNDYDEDDYFTI